VNREEAKGAEKGFLPAELLPTAVGKLNTSTLLQFTGYNLNSGGITLRL
jgi:hypothetical protein